MRENGEAIGETFKLRIQCHSNDKTRSLATLTLEGIDAVDFEDISIGNGPEPGESYIYVGDIGNNDYDRESFQVYRFKEPNFPKE